MIKFIRKNELIKQSVSHQNDKFKEVILKNGEIPGLLQFAKSKFNIGDKIEEHVHESMYVIFYVLKGEVIVMDDEEKVIANEGDTFVIYPLQKHSLRFNKKTELMYFNIAGELSPPQPVADRFAKATEVKIEECRNDS